MYSRAIVGELCPQPVSPLTATAGGGGVELNRAWREVYAETGLLPADAARAEAAYEPVVSFGGHLYLNTSLLRLFGMCGTGADPMTFARQHLGERPDVPRRRHENLPVRPDATLLTDWVARALRGGELSSPHAEIGRGVRGLRTGRPTLCAQPPSALAARIQLVRAELNHPLRLLVAAELATSIAAELLTRTSEDAGHPSLTGELVAGSGTSITESTAQLWAIAEQVRRSHTLTVLFDRGVATVADLLSTAPGGEIGTFNGSLRRLLAAHGHLGPAEWELSTQTWDTDIRLPLTLIDALRRGDTQPARTRSGDRAYAPTRPPTRSVEAVRHALLPTPTGLDRFNSALTATRHWIGVREYVREIVSTLHHEQRLAARELARPHVESGLLDDPEQIFMLTRCELDEFTAAPERLGETLRLRAYDYRALASYWPPFTTIGQPPPVVRWPGTRASKPAATASPRPHLVRGTSASGGIASGPARLLRSIAAANQTRSGDVLVVTDGGPTWIPLLPLAAAVVTDDAAPLSQLAVACRDLGIPCVVATTNATTQIKPGSRITVNGSTATVCLARPASPTPAPET